VRCFGTSERGRCAGAAMAVAVAVTAERDAAGAWGVGELCSPEPIAGGYGDPLRVPVTVMGTSAGAAGTIRAGGAAAGDVTSAGVAGCAHTATGVGAGGACHAMALSAPINEEMTYGTSARRPIRRALVAKKLAFIESCLRELRSESHPERIAHDVRELRFVEHTLQIAIQAALDDLDGFVAAIRARLSTE